MPRSERVFKKRKNIGKPKNPSTASNIQAVPSTSSASASTSATNSDPGLLQESSSKKKIDLSMYDSFAEESTFRYNIVNLNFVNELLTEMCVCKLCHGSVKLFAKRVNGLLINIHLECEKCKIDKFKHNSDQLDYECDGKSESFSDVNIRLVYALRSIGKGELEAKTLCGILNLPPPPTQYSKLTRILGSAAEKVCRTSMREAVDEAVRLNENERDIAVAFDGTWQKRGHTSLNGVVTATSVETGRVIDCEILSKFCVCAHKQNNVHNETCIANYIGTSGGMEVAGVSKIFERSLQTYNVRYEQYLGDGDSRAFKHIVESKPYGSDFTISKLECLGHVQKRMGSRLRTMKKKVGTDKLSDGKTIGGRGRLTDALINKIQVYYGQAIRNNTDDLDRMKRAIWSIYFHLWSSNKKPRHGLCPKGPESWCKYQKAVVSGGAYNHDEHDHYCSAIMLAMKPIFSDLSNSGLLQKCLHSSTQNPNESVNSIIWSRIPKTVFVRMKTLQLGVYDAVSCFNKGNIAKCFVITELGMNIGKNCLEAMKKKDMERIQKAEIAIREYSQESRQKKNVACKALEELYTSEEDPDEPSYSAGIH